MSKPESIKIDPWVGFPRYSDSIFGDDFVHNTLFACKVAAKSSRSTVNIKETVSNKGGNWAVADDVKLWFSLPQQGHSLYARVKSSNYVKLHYDMGIKNIKNRNWNFYGSLVSNKSLQNLVFKIGATHVSKACHSDNRFRIQSSTGSDYSYFWSHRTVVNHEKWTFGMLGVYDISHNICQKSNLLLKYSHDANTDVILKADTEGFRKKSPSISNFKSWFDVYSLDIVKRINDTTRVGLEAALVPADQPLRNFEVVAEKYIPQRKLNLKAKVNHKFDFAVSGKLPLWGFEDIATFTKGIAVSNVTGKDRRISYGWQIDLNV